MKITAGTILIVVASAAAPTAEAGVEVPDGTLCPPGPMGGSDGTATDGTGCCWDSYEDINRSEMEWNGTLCRSDGKCAAFEGIRTYVICPDTTFEVPDEGYGLNITKANVTVRCGFDDAAASGGGEGDGNCTFVRGFGHIHVGADESTPIGNVTFRGITSVDAGEYNVRSVGTNGMIPGTVSFVNCTFKDDSGNFGVVRHGIDDDVGDKNDKASKVELSFEGCTFENNENTGFFTPPDDVIAQVVATNAPISFVNSTFRDNFVPYFGPAVPSALISSMCSSKGGDGNDDVETSDCPPLTLIGNRFERNEVGNSIVVADEFRAAGNVFVDSTFQADSDNETCVGGVLSKGRCFDEEEEVFDADTSAPTPTPMETDTNNTTTSAPTVATAARSSSSRIIVEPSSSSLAAALIGGCFFATGVLIL